MTPEDYPVIDAADARRKAVIGLESGYVGIGALCKYMLRILDAFDAMEREKWFLDTSPTMGTWHVLDGEGGVITEGHDSPLAALLAAADTIKEPTDG